MVPLSMKRTKLSVLFSGSCPPKIPLPITINHLVNFGLINVEPNSLEIFVQSHYPFWMIYNFASNTFPFYDTSNENNFQLDLLRPPQTLNADDVDAYVHLSKYILKNVVNFRRYLSIHPVVILQYSYQKITVPQIRWLKKWDRLKDLFKRW